MSASLGSGQVESHPERRIIHFGSPPDETYITGAPEPQPDPVPTAEPEPEKPVARWWKWGRS